MVAPITDEYRQKMNDLAAFLDDLFNGDLQGDDRKVGFCLLVFNFPGKGEENRMNYISNADRAGMLSSIKEYIAHLEGRHIGDEHGTKQ